MLDTLFLIHNEFAISYEIVNNIKISLMISFYNMFHYQKKPFDIMKVEMYMVFLKHKGTCCKMLFFFIYSVLKKKPYSFVLYLLSSLIIFRGKSCEAYISITTPRPRTSSIRRRIEKSKSEEGEVAHICSPTTRRIYDQDRE